MAVLTIQDESLALSLSVLSFHPSGKKIQIKYNKKYIYMVVIPAEK